MLDMLEYEFMRNALVAGLLASAVLGIIGTYVVVKRIVFISGGISHASFGGVGLAFYLGWNPLLGAAIFALASALGIGAVSKKTLQREDTTIGILWAVGMAMGAFFIYITPGYPPNPGSYLFGNILMVGQVDIQLLAALCVAVIVSTVLLYHKLQAVTFDEEFSTVMGVPTFALYMFLLVMTALSVVLLIKFIGIILVIAMFTIPSSIVGQFTHDLRRMMVGATALAALFITVGLWLSFRFDLMAGATIVMLSGAVFLVVTLLKKLADSDITDIDESSA
jgi:zinc transport system permease protein